MRKLPATGKPVFKGPAVLEAIRGIATTTSIGLLGWWIYLGCPVPEVLLNIQFALGHASELIAEKEKVEIEGKDLPAIFPLPTIPISGAGGPPPPPSEIARSKFDSVHVGDTLTFAGAIPAYMGGENKNFWPHGHGADAFSTSGNDCRSKTYKVLFITDTLVNGSHSFHTIVSDSLDLYADGTRFVFVIPRTGGRMNTATNTELANLTAANCIYLAGQAAPGDGYFLTSDDTMQDADLHTRTGQDIVIRGWGFWPNRLDGAEQGKGFQFLSYYTAVRRIIVDHNSLGFGFSDAGGFSTGRRKYKTARLTVSHNLFNVSRHSGNFQAQTLSEENYDKWTDSISIDRNLWVSGTRNPLVTSINLDLINNMEYNKDQVEGGEWEQTHDTLEAHGIRSAYHLIRNYGKPGNLTSSTGKLFLGEHKYRQDGYAIWYAAMNMAVGRGDSTVDQYLLCRDDPVPGICPDTIFHDTLVADVPLFGLWDTLSARQAHDSVIKYSRRLAVDSFGRLSLRTIAAEDSVYKTVEDSLDIEEWNTRASRGVEAWGGWGTVDPGTAPSDDDSDGIPSALELWLTNGASATSVPPDSVCSRYGYWCVQTYVDGYWHQMLSVFYQDSIPYEDSTQVFLNSVWKDAFTTRTGVGSALYQGLFNEWSIGDTLLLIVWLDGDSAHSQKLVIKGDTTKA